MEIRLSGHERFSLSVVASACLQQGLAESKQKPRICGLALWAVSPDKIFFPVLGYPDQVQVNGENTMGTFAIVAHALSLKEMLKPQPRAEQYFLLF